MLGLKRTQPDGTMAPPPDAGAATAQSVLRGVIRAEDIGFVLCDAGGTITQAGGAVADIIGLGANERLEGRALEDVLDELGLSNAEGSGALDLDELSRVVAAVTSSGQSRRVSTLAMTHDGRTLSIRTYFPGDGTVVATLRDVSDIAADRMTLNAAVAGAKAGYWSLDLQSGAFSYSESVTARLSRKERDIIQKHGLFAIIHKEDTLRISAQWQDIITGVAPFDITYRVETESDGLMWQRSIGQLLRRPDGKLTKAVAFVMDITEDMKNRADLEEAQDLAREKADFLARMSHEIRTPLNAIIGMADSLSDEPLGEEAREVVGDIERAAEDLHGLLSRTLDHAKMEAGRVRADFSPTDPRDVLRATAAMWRARAEAKGLALHLSVGENVPELLPLDTFRLRQCLNNLMSNALKFTEDGSVALAARRAKREGRDCLAIIVRDTGIGMDAEAQRTVFDPYRQADGSITRQYGGTGLGLAICRQLAAVMDGEIALRSQPGEGSAFLLFLPLEPSSKAPESAGTETGEALAPPAAPDTLPRLPFEGLSVLCVEDNPINQKVVERLIGKRVSQLHFASHGREALSVLNTVHVDVVLMDIHMPVMDGIETTMAIRQSEAAYANVIIIALTADEDYQQMRICRNIGMDDTIAKPVRREDILEAFNRTLGQLGATHGTRIALR